MSVDKNEQITFEKVKEIKKAYEDELMSKANVIGVGIGFRQESGLRTEKLALVIMVERKLSVSQLSARDLIPVEIDGVPVDVQEVGKIRSQA
jgi:hypothetical protein